MALQKEEPFAVRAAALRFLAVAMTVSSSEAAQEARHKHTPPQEPAPITLVFCDPASPHRSSLPSAASASPCVQNPDVLTKAALVRLACASPADEHDLIECTDGQSQQGVTVQAPGSAGPLLLQSDCAARQYTQGIWDFGVEQLLLQAASFWEQLPDLLQVQSC